MRQLLTAASNMTLSLALALVLSTGFAVSKSAAQSAGIRCQGPPPGCTEVIPCLVLDCCETFIVIHQCGCSCLPH